MSPEERIKARARELGFELTGIAAANEAESFDRLCAWLDAGHAGEMSYLHRHRQARRHPQSIFPGVRSVVMLGINYKPAEEERPSLALPACQLTGQVARYARGEDYHQVLRDKLNALLAWIQQEFPGTSGRGVVDTAPLLERDFARRAGLGWFGKNTMLLNRRLGSYFFLAALLLDLPLTPDPPHATSHCGTCTACLDACPTAAFPAPGVLDSRRCISYLTIELKGELPQEAREQLHGWVFGCDVCQEVCPWNRKAPAGQEPRLQPRPGMSALPLLELLSLSPEEFRQRFRDTALWRSKRQGMIRNALLLLAASQDRQAIPACQNCLNDPDPVIRATARWALQQFDLTDVDTRTDS